MPLAIASTLHTLGPYSSNLFFAILGAVTAMLVFVVYRWMAGSKAIPPLPEWRPGMGFGAVARLAPASAANGRESGSSDNDQGSVSEILETAGALVLVLDRHGRIVRFNRACQETTGFSAEEMLGRHVWDALLLPQDADLMKARFANLCPTGFPDRCEYHWLTRNEGRRYISWSSTALLDEAGAVEYVISVGIDMTEHKKLEAQFLHSQKMEAVGRLAGGIAHDFNNLLTAITGYSELVLQTLGDGHPLQKDVEEIKRASERAASLTRQLLAFSRKQLLNPRVLDLNNVVSEMERMMVRLVGEDITLTMKLEPSLSPLKADPSQLEQVILNLILNARDATPGPGNILIETMNVRPGDFRSEYLSDVPPGSYVMLSVSDNGTGMTEEVRARLFEPFFTTKEQGKGTGLGLSTVYGIISQSGGSIAVSSELGHGSTFRIFLPVAEGEAAPAEPQPNLGEAPSGNETVLLVEDEDEVRGVAGKILRQKGYAVLEARDGAEALEIARGAAYIDIVLADIMMPGLNGPETVRLLRGVWPDVCVLYMSGRIDPAATEHIGLESGACFLSKPFSADELAWKVRELLDTPHGRTLAARGGR